MVLFVFTFLSLCLFCICSFVVLLFLSLFCFVLRFLISLFLLLFFVLALFPLVIYMLFRSFFLYFFRWLSCLVDLCSFVFCLCVCSARPSFFDITGAFHGSCCVLFENPPGAGKETLRNSCSPYRQLT